ncbi:hypothetical protein OBJ92_08540 [Empedobacter falsenii]
MADLLFILSVLLFYSCFGINMLKGNQEFYISKPNEISTIYPWFVGMILPVFPFSYLFDIHWLAILVLNIPILLFIGPFITKRYIHLFASGKGLDKDIKTSLIFGIAIFIIALLINKT